MVKTEKLDRVVPDATVTVKTWVAPGALNISKLGETVTWADNGDAISRREPRKPSQLSRPSVDEGAEDTCRICMKHSDLSGS